MTTHKTYHFADTTERLDDTAAAHLLPNYDELLIAYKDHGVAYDPTLAPTPAPRAVPFSNHSVVMNGLVVGAWRREGTGKKSRVEHQLWVKLGRAEKSAFDAAVSRAERFHAE